MEECKAVNVYIHIGENLYVDQCLKTWENMSHVSYDIDVGILVYGIVNTRLETAHGVEVLW